MAGQHVQLSPVFGDRAPGDHDVLLLELVDQLIVGERLGRVFTGDELGQNVLHRGVGHRLTVGRRHTGGEEELHFEDPLRRAHELAGDRSTHGRLMDTHHLGHHDHGHGLEVLDSFFHEIPLTLHDLAADAQNGALALVETLDEKLAGLDLVAHVFPDLGGSFRLSQQVFVGAANAQLGHELILASHVVLHFLALLGDREKIAQKDPVEIGHQDLSHPATALHFLGCQLLSTGLETFVGGRAERGLPQEPVVQAFVTPHDAGEVFAQGVQKDL